MRTLSSAPMLAGMALLTLGGIGAAMLVLPIPAANAQSVTFILGALAGALTMQPSQRPAAAPDVVAPPPPQSAPVIPKEP